VNIVLKKCGGARASARFNVRDDKAGKNSAAMSFHTLKRRED